MGTYLTQYKVLAHRMLGESIEGKNVLVHGLSHVIHNDLCMRTEGSEEC